MFWSYVLDGDFEFLQPVDDENSAEIVLSNWQGGTYKGAHV